MNNKRICKIEGCEEKFYGKGMCKKHYNEDYFKSEKGKEIRQRHSKSEKRKEQQKKYSKSERGKEAQQKYFNSEKGKEVKRRNKQKRRALKNNSQVEDFTNLEIFERDKWKCGICGLDVDKSLCYPDKSSASLDHIVPLSRGGSHTKENVQCSHLSCNLKKWAN